MNVEEIQRALLRAGYGVGKAGADGKFGADTRKAMQAFQRAKGLKVTTVADAATINALQSVIAVALKPVVAAVAAAPPKQSWPKQSGCDAFYGNPRGRDPTKPSAAWEAANLTTISPPFRMTYDGKAIKTIRVHTKCAASLLRVLNAIWVAAGRSQVIVDAWGASIYGGAYNYRLMRGGDALSMHSWGCAIDLDPGRNGFGAKSPNFAKVPAVLKAFADEGWVWGGKWSKPDGMHFQAANV